jgi:hypothetical protein
MATKRRMVSLKVIDTDEFLDMPQSSQYLYYNLLTRADDDGFLGNPKRIMRMVGCNDDDMRVLTAKGYVIPFERGVCVIRHWRVHNLIRSDRYVETEYIEEKKKLVEINGKYEEKQNVIPNDNQLAPQVKLSKVSIDNNICLFNEFWEEYPRKENKKKAQEIWTRKNLDKKYEKIISFISKAKQTDRWNKGITPHATTFLNQERWEDELEGYGKIEKKPFYRGDPMVKVRDKWKVIINGEFYEFADSEDKIVWK